MRLVLVISFALWILIGQLAQPPVSTPPGQKLAIPEPDKLKAAQKEVRQTFDIKGAKTPDQKSALAKEIARAATDSKGDSVKAYALGMEAADLYVSFGDAQSAFRVIDDLGLTFAIPASKTKLGLIKKAAGAAKLPAQKRILALVGLKAATDAAANEEYAVAKELSTLALAQARPTGDQAAIKRANDQQVKFTELLKAWRNVEQARKTLLTEPGNAEANEVVGRYLCLHRQKWTEGLPSLAKGADETLRIAGNMDLDGEDSRALAIANSWWDVADRKKKERSQILPRFAFWAEKVLPSLQGVAKTNLEKRLAEAQEAMSGRKFAKILSEVPSGIRSAGTVDCSSQAVKATMGKSFVMSQSWLLALQFKAPNLDDGAHVVFSWADGRPGADAIIVGFNGNVFGAAVDDCVGNTRQRIDMPMPPEIVGTWVDVKLVHDAVSQELELYIDNRLIQKDPLTITPRIDQEMPVSLGAIDGSDQRFVGQIQNVWLGNIK